MWDYWHVPEQYTLIRTPADHFFREEVFNFFLRSHKKNLWDYWHVPEQYTLIRTPADHFFCEEVFNFFLTLSLKKIYTLIRTPVEHFFCEEVFNFFLHSHTIFFLHAHTHTFCDRFFCEDGRWSLFTCFTGTKYKY